MGDLLQSWVSSVFSLKTDAEDSNFRCTFLEKENDTPVLWFALLRSEDVCGTLFPNKRRRSVCNWCRFAVVDRCLSAMLLERFFPLRRRAFFMHDTFLPFLTGKIPCWNCFSIGTLEALYAGPFSETLQIKQIFKWLRHQIWNLIYIWTFHSVWWWALILFSNYIYCNITISLHLCNLVSLCLIVAISKMLCLSQFFWN